MKMNQHLLPAPYFHKAVSEDTRGLLSTYNSNNVLALSGQFGQPFVPLVVFL